MSDRLSCVAADVMKYVGYGAYDACLVLTGPQEQRDLNFQAFKKTQPTDVLSFPSLLTTEPEPGAVDDLYEQYPFESADDPEYEMVSEMMNLGDIFICPRYVEYVLAHDVEGASGDLGYDEWSDLGASGAMKACHDVEGRCAILIVHGLLHLIGFDHLEVEDREIMQKLEEEIVREVLGELVYSEGKI